MRSRTNSLIKELPLAYYQFFSALISVYCPICKRSTSRTRTYRSLKSLSWHLSHNHRNDIDYPVKLEQIQEILKIIALAKQLEILP